MTKYVLDTNVYIRAFRDLDAAGELAAFLSRHAPAIHLSSVVLHELLVGANTRAKEREIEKRIAAPLVRVGRVITPGHGAWIAAGEAIAAMARKERRDLRSVPKSLVHDYLIAVSCREAGAVLVTANVADFEGVGRYVLHEFAAPWPSWNVCTSGIR